MEHDLTTIHSREMFNLLGNEKIALGNEGAGHVSLSTLKSWVLHDLAKDLNVTNIDNTRDVNKPLSQAQRIYIDGVIKNFTSALQSLQTQLAMVDEKITILTEEIDVLKSTVNSQ